MLRGSYVKGSVSDRKPVSVWFSTLCTLPWLVAASAYIEACVVRLILSRWPRPSYDDPKQLVTAPVHLIFQLLLISLPVAILFLIVWFARNWQKTIRDWRYGVRVGVFVWGLLAFWMISQYDPGQV